MAVQLTFLSRELRKFADLSFRWLDVKTFAMTGAEGAGDRDVLEALVAHEQFDDSYDAPPDLWKPGSARHGDYRLAAIGPESYELVSRKEASAHIAQFIHRPAETENLVIHGDMKPPASGRTPDEHQAFADSLIEQADAVYRLRDLGREGEVFLETLWFFHELVLIDRASEHLTLLVGAVD